MDNNTEAIKIAKNLTPVINQVAKGVTDNCMRSKLYTVSSSPSNGKIGVKDAFDDVEMKIPYSSTLAKSNIGDAVWCVWMGSNQSTMVAMWAGDLVSYKGEVKPKPYTLLWQNPSPTSDFAAQTVSFDLSAWDFIAIGAKTTTNGTNEILHFVKVGNGTTLSVPNLGSTQYFYKRDASTSASGITFSIGYRNTSGTTGAQYCIPTSIYGVY